MESHRASSAIRGDLSRRDSNIFSLQRSASVLNPPSHRTAKDLREGQEVVDPEQQKKFDEIVEMLLAAGYFRARISTLSPFDKVIGGLAWSITASNVDVDVDIFFQENATIGQKIKLGEQILKALIRMKCPVRLQSHQIQGLDYNSIFPVIQWLVKKVIETREETGDLLRKFSLWNYHHNAAIQPSSPEVFDNLFKSESTSGPVSVESFKAVRKYKQTSKWSPTAPEEEKVQATLLEYGVKPTFVRIAQPSDKAKASQKNQEAANKVAAALGLAPNKEAEEDEEKAKAEHERQINNMMKKMADSAADTSRISGAVIGKVVGIESDTIRKLVSEYDAQRRIDGHADEGAQKAYGLEAHKRQVEYKKKQILDLQSKLDDIRSKHTTLGDHVKKLEDTLFAKQSLNNRILAEIQKLNAMETPENSKDLAMLRSLVALNEKLKMQEAQFRASCKKQLAALHAKIAELKEKKPDAEQQSREKMLIETLEKDTSKMQEIRNHAAKKNREIALVERKIDEVPSRTELQQYQRMFVELYEQVHSKLIETKQYYISYNTLTETKTFLSKEVSILKSIDENYKVAMSSKAKKDKFLESLATILTSFTQNHDKVEQELKEKKAGRDKLNNEYLALVEKERAYYKASKEFQEECGKNAQLLAHLNTLESS